MRDEFTKRYTWPNCPDDKLKDAADELEMMADAAPEIAAFLLIEYAQHVKLTPFVRVLVKLRSILPMNGIEVKK